MHFERNIWERPNCSLSRFFLFFLHYFYFVVLSIISWYKTYSNKYHDYMKQIKHGMKSTSPFMDRFVMKDRKEEGQAEAEAEAEAQGEAEA